ncbi:MAG: PilZ domain-containing protein [Desulfomicrobium sp.]|nr:PilZ domain-containing protein [Pseudomonadota bacterium]MBV1711184.1 PilZ domain-containing protein [Desulfomicrobium sp.]MBU4569855.1 PilZ domain-containing protein [Pseudomonadota bacterium]MBU4594954.1 PilZ domain-containing protein [Pseudomonadota bacterium]MBV1718926.1 PilZ domain-containing protein [Desulfomicrobium sp.]
MLNKRKSPRKASLEQCSVELYASARGPYPSRVVNYSDRGLMIEMDHPLTAGEPVKILFRPGAENAQRLGESYCVGMVRWCAPQEGLFSGRYGVGLEMAQASARRKTFRAA